MIVVSVSKGYQNVQKRRRTWGKHNCKPIWYAYIITDDDRFTRKRISTLEVPLYKTKIRRKRTLICDDCNNEFIAYVKNEREKVECPFCNS